MLDKPQRRGQSLGIGTASALALAGWALVLGPGLWSIVAKDRKLDLTIGMAWALSGRCTPSRVQCS